MGEQFTLDSRAPTLDSEKGSKQANILASEASVQESVNLVTPDPFGSTIPLDRSYWLNQDKFKNIIQTNAEGITFKSPSDIGFFAGGNIFESINGDRQSVVGGSDHHFAHGDYTQQTGNQTSEKQKAAADLQKITGAIDKKKMDTIKSDEGEDYPCPICQQKILTERAANIANRWFKVIRKYLPNFPFSLDVIQRYVSMLIVPFLSTTSNLALNGGKGCGSPGCKNGMVKSVQKGIQKANQQAASELKTQQEQINAAQRKMGSGGSAVKSDTGDVIWRVGLAKNDAPTCTETVHTATHFGYVNAQKPGEPLTADSKGSAKLCVHSDPLINPGSLFIDVSNKLTLAAGSPGVEIETSGKAVVNASTTTIAATQGELTLTSANRTFLKGKNIIIDAKDRSGDTGVRIESDNTIVAGKLSVTGDLALKGSIMMDGGLHCTHLTCPSERIPTSPTSLAHQVHSNANWNGPTRPQATLFDQYDKAYKRLSRDLAALLTRYTIVPEYVKTVIEETYSTAMISSVVDGLGQPTGFAIAMNYTTLMPLDVVGMSATGGPVKGIVIPAIIPIYNYTHNHGSPGSGHSHDTSVPAFDGHDNAAASRAARPSPSHVPTPAKPHGMGQGAGPKSLGDNTSCGGGGLFGRKTPAQAISDRNAVYGVVGDPFDGTNYVPVDVPFNPDGTLKDPPQFNIC
jgi:hypothetical protein